MKLFKTKTKIEPVVIQTTQEMIDAATDRLYSDITDLKIMKDNALSSFRAVANNLGGINENLKDKVDKLESLISFAKEEKGVAEKMISDNDAVRKKILDIIGE